MPRANSYKQMVCLVGENPLPVYLGVKQYAQDIADIILVHSPQTRDAAYAIKAKLEAENAGSAGTVNRTCDPQKLPKPYDPGSVKKILQGIKEGNPEAVLNYTGGTKVMSAFAVQTWQSHFLNAFYLEEASGQFHFGDVAGDTEPLNLALTIDDLRILHKVDRTIHERFTDATLDELKFVWQLFFTGWKFVNAATTARKVEDKVRSRRDKPLAVYEWFQNQYDARKPPEQRWRANTEWAKFLQLLPIDMQNRWRRTPLPANLNDFYDEGHIDQASDLHAQYRFLCGVWLEELVQKLAERHVPDIKLICGQHFEIDGQEFESDVVAVEKHGLRYISVTTTYDGERVHNALKGKMFEAIHRARQLGGGLANVCVVCVSENNVINECQKSIGIKSPHRFYGKSEVENWINGTTASLQNFLTK